MTEKEKQMRFYQILIGLSKKNILKSYSITTDDYGNRTDTFCLFNNNCIKYLFDNDDCFIDCWTE